MATQKRWQLYERVIEELERQHKDCKVTPNHHVKGIQSGQVRQVDIWLEATVGGLEHRLTIAVECRDYGKKKLGIKDLDAFYGFLADVGAEKGVLVTTSSFTRGALARARGARIETKTLTFDEALEFDWGDYVSGDGCETYSGCNGRINWQYEDDQSQTECGSCGECGVFHIHCGFCGVHSSYPENEPVQPCENEDCSATFRLQYESGMVVGISAALRH